MTRRVLVYDPYPDPDWAAALAQAINSGIEVVVPWDPDDADAELPGAHIVIVTGRRRIGAEQLAVMKSAVGIVCFSIGMDQVDASAAAAQGIPVTNIPDYCTEEVADHALALLLAAQRRLVPLAVETGTGRWTGHRTVDTTKLRRLRGQTVGILGAGRIGQAVGERARAFGMRTIAYDPLVTATGQATAAPSRLESVSLVELAERCDALVLCAALTPQSRGIIGPDYLSRVRPGLIIVNVARGGLIDETALVHALDAGRVAVAALDVRTAEPPEPAGDFLAGRADVIVTPHIAGTSVEAFDELLVKTGIKVRELLAAVEVRQ